MKLLNFQEQVVKDSLYFLEHNETHSCYNCCEQGLGKSVMACAVINHLQPGQTIIISPAIMKLTWLSELNIWLTNPKDYEIIVIDSSQDLAQLVNKITIHNAEWFVKKHIVLMSYALVHMPAAIALFEKVNFRLFIGDELQYIKSSKAKRTRAILKYLWPQSYYHYGLSGTPFTTEVVDGYTVFHKMCPSQFPDFNSFVRDYSYVRASQWGLKYYGLKNAPMLSNIIRSKFYIRRTKAEVLKDLPDKIYQTIYLPEKFSITLETLKKARDQMVPVYLQDDPNDTVFNPQPKPVLPEDIEINAAYNQLIKQLDAGETLTISPVLQTLLRLQGEAKVDPVCEFAVGLIEQGIPIVIFGHHTNVLEGIYQRLKCYNPVVIEGTTCATDRQENVRKFQNGETLVFIGQVVAAGVGITLTKSSHCLMAESCWSPTTFAQSIDRLHRIGQKNVVNVYSFTVKNSWDEHLQSVMLTRAKNFKEVLDTVHT